MINTLKTGSVVLTALLMCMLMGVPALAAGEVSFVVSPILPENQRNEITGYFDLAVKPGQTQELSVAVTNRAGEAITVEVEAITASTNLNGVVNYTTAGETHDSLPHSLANLIEIEEKVVTIPANDTRMVTARVEMPEEPYDGYLLGSIHVKKQLTEEEFNSGQTILNQYSYVIAVKLTETEAVVANDFVLDEVEAELVNSRASVVNRIVNPSPILVKGMSATAKVLPAGSDTPIMERTMDKVDMAPNSVFPFTLVDDAGYGVRAGDYLSQIELRYNEEVWTFEREFTITPETAAAINSNAVNLDTRQTAMTQSLPVWLVVALITGLILLLTAILLFLYLIRKTKSVGQSRN